jgi:hypothetical protein
VKSLALSLGLVLVMVGCRTPAYLGGEFSHRDPDVKPKAPVESLVAHQRWIFFWGLAGTEKIDLPEVGGGFNIQDELGRKFADNERIVDLTIEEGMTVPGLLTSIFTLGIVQQREVVVKGRRADAPGVSSGTTPEPARTDTP